MKVLHTILSHWPADQVDQLIALHQLLEPTNEYLLAYGGKPENFEKIQFPNKVFLADPCLRGPTDTQNYACWVTAVADYVKSQPTSPDLVYFTETDHLMLRKGYGATLVEIMEKSGQDFLGKWCMDRSHTNEFFFLRYRDHAPLLAHLKKIAPLPDPVKIWGALADGMLFRWKALEGLASVDLAAVPCFTEILFPSTLARLGFKLGDFDTYSDFYKYVRYRPDYPVEEVQTIASDGGWCCHPFKQASRLGEVIALFPKGN